MAEETLLTASRRVVRFMNIDMNGHGGLIHVKTLAALETLDIQVERAAAAEKRAADWKDMAAKAAEQEANQ